MATRQRDARSRLYQVAEGQAGYFTAAQAREAGYSHAAQHYHAKVGTGSVKAGASTGWRCSPRRRAASW
jgi:hypothetical protein